MKTADGGSIDPSTGTVSPEEGPSDDGHTPGFEWRRTLERARIEGGPASTVIEYANNPSHGSRIPPRTEAGVRDASSRNQMTTDEDGRTALHAAALDDDAAKVLALLTRR